MFGSDLSREASWKDSPMASVSSSSVRGEEWGVEVVMDVMATMGEW